MALSKPSAPSPTASDLKQLCKDARGPFQELFEDATEAWSSCWSFIMMDTPSAEKFQFVRDQMGIVVYAVAERAAEVVYDMLDIEERDAEDRVGTKAELMLRDKCCGTLLLVGGIATALEPTGISSSLALCGLSIQGKMLHGVIGIGMCVGSVYITFRHQPNLPNSAVLSYAGWAMGASAFAHILFAGDFVPPAVLDYFTEPGLALHYMSDFVTRPLTLAGLATASGVETEDTWDVVALSTAQTALLLATCTVSSPLVAYRLPCSIAGGLIILAIRQRLYDWAANNRVNAAVSDRSTKTSDVLVCVWNAETAIAFLRGLDLLGIEQAVQAMAVAEAGTTTCAQHILTRARAPIEDAEEYLNNRAAQRAAAARAQAQAQAHAQAQAQVQAQAQQQRR